MTNKHCFKALDKSLRDIHRLTNDNSQDKPFGGMTVVMGDDFRQTQPVIPKGRRSHIVDASLKCSYLWKHFEEIKLTKNKRLTALTSSTEEQQKTKEFLNGYILTLGDGLAGDKEDGTWIKIPKDLILQKGQDELETIVNSTYPELSTNYNNRTQRRGPSYVQEMRWWTTSTIT